MARAVHVLNDLCLINRSFRRGATETGESKAASPAGCVSATHQMVRWPSPAVFGDLAGAGVSKLVLAAGYLETL